MTYERRIYAAHDDAGIYVYQAFKPSIVRAALKNGTFGKGFNMARMTWIKPSFAWMLYRSGYATKTRQKAILKIKLTHQGFQTILEEGIETAYNSSLYESEWDWRTALDASSVRFQWDPERNLRCHRHPTRRALQLGLRGWVVEKYVHEWIISMEEVTDLAHRIKNAVENNHPLPDVPEEPHYPVSEALQKRLRITTPKI